MAEQYHRAGPAMTHSALLPGLLPRTLRYTGVGAICAALNNVLIIGGSFLGVGFVVTSVFAFVVVTPLGYFMHTNFTFRRSPSVGNLLRFYSTTASGFPVFIVLMSIFCNGFGTPVFIATPLATVALYFWNYALAHWAVLHRGRLR